MNKIVLSNVSFAYSHPFKVIFSNLNLEIDDSWKTVVIGKNGEGKSTLLKLISGELKRDSGTIKSKNNFFYFPYEIENINDKVINIIKEIAGPYFQLERQIEEALNNMDMKKYSVLEEEYKKIDGYNIDAIIKKECEKIGLEDSILDSSYNTLSGGEKTKVKIVSLFIKQGTFPLLDEPTNHLDLESRESLSKYLSKKSKGFICVSHDAHFLNKVGSHIIDIDAKNGINISNAKFNDYYQNKASLEMSTIKKNYELKKDILQKSKSISEKIGWSGTSEKKKIGARDKGYVSSKSTKLMRAAKNLETRINRDIEQKKELVKKLEKSYEIKFFNYKTLPKNFLTVENLMIEYDGKVLVPNLSFTIKKGERVALIGKNGSGKSSIIKKILNKDKGVFFHKYIKVSSVNQELSYDESNVKDYLLKNAIDAGEFGRFLASFNLRENILLKSFKNFSQGELRKFSLALSIYSKAHIYIWDEPLNFLDYKQIEKLKKAILKYEPTILFVEHNKSFIDSIATKVIKVD